MAKNEFDRARADVDAKTIHLSDVEFATEIEALIVEARASHPEPSKLLGVIYRDSAEVDHSEVSLTLTS